MRGRRPGCACGDQSGAWLAFLVARMGAIWVQCRYARIARTLQSRDAIARTHTLQRDRARHRTGAAASARKCAALAVCAAAGDAVVWRRWRAQLSIWNVSSGTVPGHEKAHPAREVVPDGDELAYPEPVLGLGSAVICSGDGARSLPLSTRFVDGGSLSTRLRAGGFHTAGSPGDEHSALSFCCGEAGRGCGACTWTGYEEMHQDWTAYPAARSCKVPHGSGRQMYQEAPPVLWAGDAAEMGRPAFNLVILELEL